MIKKENIICLSSQDWNSLWTRKQRFMQKFASHGNRVLYIEAQSSLISLGVFKKDWLSMFRWLYGPKKIDNNLYIANLPPVIPFFRMSKLINEINSLFISRLLKYWIKKLGFINPILWTYNPHSERLIGKLGEKLAVYDCVDEFTASKGLIRSKIIYALEKRLIEKVNVVIVTHQNLYKSKGHLTKDLYLIPNGTEPEHFKKASLPEIPLDSEILKIPKPIIGFLGCIEYWIDLDLIRHIALSKPEWSIVLIGPAGRLAKLEKIKNLSNIYLLGKKDYACLPSYLKAWDVCINPYILDKTAENCSPLKLYDYLAAGKPVVSVNMPEARKFDGLVEIGLNYEHFIEKIQKTLKSLPEDPAKIAARMKAVENHSWENLFSELEKVIERYL